MRMIKSYITLVCLILLCQANCFGQKEFQKELDQIEEELRIGAFEKKDSLKFFSSLKNLKEKYRNNFLDCEYQYSYYRLVAKYFYDTYEDQKYIDLTRDSILVPLIKCHGEIHHLVSLSYFNIANLLYYNHWGTTEEIEAYYHKCLKIENLLENPSEYSSKIYSNIGEFYNALGDADRSLLYNQAALKSMKKFKRGINEIHIYHFIARAQENLLLFDEAIENYQKAIEVAKREFPNDDHELVSDLYSDQGETHFKNGNFKKAELSLLKALRINNKFFPEDIEKIDRHRTKLALVYAKLDRFSEAKKLLNLARNNYELYEGGDLISFAYWINECYASSYYQEGKIDSALYYIQTGIQTQMNGLNNNVLDNPTIEGAEIVGSLDIISALAKKSKYLEAKGKITEDQVYYLSAIDAVRKLDSLIKIQISKDFEEGSQYNVIKQYRKDYKNGIEAAIMLAKTKSEDRFIQDAYDLVSRIKSQLLRRSIEHKKKNQELVSEQINIQLDSLHELILSKEEVYTSALMAGNEKEKKDGLAELFKAKETLDIFEKENGLKNLLKESDIFQTQSLTDIQNKLKTGQAVLEYHLDEDQLLSFLISSENISYTQEKLSSDEIIELYNQITVGKKLDVNEISKKLLSILDESNFQGTDLIIIPDKELLQIPFEALKYKGKYLVELFNVSYEYSSGFLLDDKDIHYDKSYVGFASDYNDPSFEVLQTNYTTNPEGILLSPLQHTIEEVESAASLLRGEANINDSASKKNFKDLSDGTQVLHLALHGVLSENFPDQSALVFSSQENDHLLSAAEIYNMDINAGLTILSACNTGVGPVKVGDGVRSLARSFIHAGSESVMTSLWDISDLSTKKILENFYIKLNQGKSKSEALRQAKLDFIENASPTQEHPKYWAHLVLIGDAGVVQSGGMNFKYVFLVIGLLAILLLFRFFSRK